MSMRGSGRRTQARLVLSAEAFAWDRALIAAMEHASLPWDDEVAGIPLADVRRLGARDRLSLLAQFAAHQALLQFAGIADGEFRAAEWIVVAKRGADVRLVRIAAAACDATDAPPVVTLAHEFAELAGIGLPILRQPWARADAIYADAFARLAGDVAADLHWVRAAACGAIHAPGDEGLRLLATQTGTFAYDSDRAADVVLRFARLERSFVPVVFEGTSPLERYSAAAAHVHERSMEPRQAAERILASTADARHLFIVRKPEAFDSASREVVRILASARHGTWLVPDEGSSLPSARWFLVAPRLRARDALRGPFETLVRSDGFAAYLARGEAPAQRSTLPPFAEPLRSYLGALALLGTRTPRASAERFLAHFGFSGSLEELCADGVTALEGESFTFAGDAVREEVAQLIPAGSRAALCRVAAEESAGLAAATLWLDAGDADRAAAALDETTFASAAELTAAFARIPASLLTPALASRYAHALIDCGRYRDARDVAPHDELVLARAERRMGDYATALARVTRLEPSFETMLLHAELLRLLDREPEAKALLATCVPESAAQRARLQYERALHGADDLPEDAYLAARIAGYRAIESGDAPAAQRHAANAHGHARTMAECIDASLDRVFSAFSAGAWDEARALAIEALREVEETQGDRAAGGILFTLAYLAADDGQWAHASQRIARLRQYYAANDDAIRIEELQLLAAHLDFSRGRFADARRAAEAVWKRKRQHVQITEAAALILDELDWMEAIEQPLRATGRSGNAELTRRREALVASRTTGEAPARRPARAAELARFRAAIRAGDETTAQRIATQLRLHYDPAPAPSDVELRVLRTAAMRDFPFAPHDFDSPWCFATRNRLGSWHTIGSHPVTVAQLESRPAADWIVCSERELLYFEGSARWSADGRDAVAAVFRTRAENQRLHRVLEQEESARAPSAHAIDGIIGRSPHVRELAALVERVARREVAICILGESGTGKELVARAIHRQSARRQKIFTPVNCAALPENLIESELFGHVRGAFTGADRDRAGLIETTDGGTLFLDEIGELPLPAQAKLLRFLQEGEFRRVGDTVNRTADVRIVSATNRRLDAAVEEGRFREDLYYRVRGVEIPLAPLRERTGDVLLLAEHFLTVEREKNRGGAAALSQDVEAVFTAYRWPGNVRELQNTIRAAHAIAGDAKTIELEHLPERLRSIVPARTAPGSYQDAVARFKRELIERALADAGGNQNRTAAALKISRQALAYQIRELGILVGAVTESRTSGGETASRGQRTF